MLLAAEMVVANQLSAAASGLRRKYAWWDTLKGVPCRNTVGDAL